MRRYILRDREVVPFVGPIEEWARFVWNEEPAHPDGGCRRVALDRFDDIEVSTVFLGLDHSLGAGPPLLFETMVFGGPDELNGEQVRTSTWAQAEQAHKAMCQRVQEAPDPPA